MKLFSATQNSLPSGSCITVQRWIPPGTSCSATTLAPSANESIDDPGLGCRQIDMHPVLRLLRLGHLREVPGRFRRARRRYLPIEACTSLLPLSRGRPSAADQNVAVFNTSSQSRLMLPSLTLESSHFRGQTVL